MSVVGLQLRAARVRFLSAKKGQPMQERRKVQRWPAYIGGRASFLSEKSTADVLIRNTSTSGAKVVVQNSLFVPDNFRLTIPKCQTEYRVRACWRHYDEIGVEFEQECVNDMPTRLSLLRRTKQLAVKNAELKHRISELSE
jgi:hypothetical protein